MTGKWQAKNFLGLNFVQRAPNLREIDIFKFKNFEQNLVKNRMKGILSLFPNFHHIPRSFLIR